MHLTTQQVAELLDVKPETVYAYVSRGMLHSIRSQDGKRSVFEAAEVQRLAERARRRKPQETTPEVRSALTLIRDGRLYYRGRDVTELARGESFEGVAEWLWSARLDSTAAFQATPETLTLARETTQALPASTRLTDRLRVIAAVASTADPFRFSIERDSVIAVARSLIAAMVDALPPLSGRGGSRDAALAAAGTPGPAHSGDRADAAGPQSSGRNGSRDAALAAAGTPGPAHSGDRAGAAGPQSSRRKGSRDAALAARLWPRLTPRPPSDEGIAALNAALVLLADHGLATSTFAARVAASSRAHAYAVVAAGLSAFDGPLHGAAATHAHRLIRDAIAGGDPVAVYAERLRTEGRVEGFFPEGHKHYPHGDVRAAELLSFVDALSVPGEMRAAFEGLMAAALKREPRRPSIEFALGALVHACGMREDAGEAIFAIARTAGWIAHALEEYEEPGLRFRIEGTYTG